MGFSSIPNLQFQVSGSMHHFASTILQVLPYWLLLYILCGSYRCVLSLCKCWRILYILDGTHCFLRDCAKRDVRKQSKWHILTEYRHVIELSFKRLVRSRKPTFFPYPRSSLPITAKASNLRTTLQVLMAYMGDHLPSSDPLARLLYIP